MAPPLRQNRYNLNNSADFDQMLIDLEAEHLEEVAAGAQYPPVYEGADALYSPSRRRSFPPNERYSPASPLRPGMRPPPPLRASRRTSVASPGTPDYSSSAPTPTERWFRAGSFGSRSHLRLSPRSPTFFGQSLQSPPAPDMPDRRSPSPAASPAARSPMLGAEDQSPPRYQPWASPTRYPRSPGSSPNRRSLHARTMTVIPRPSPLSPRRRRDLARLPGWSLPTRPRAVSPRPRSPGYYPQGSPRRRSLDARALTTVARSPISPRRIRDLQGLPLPSGLGRPSSTARSSFAARLASAPTRLNEEAPPFNPDDLFDYEDELEDELDFGPSAAQRMSEAAEAELDARAAALRLQADEHDRNQSREQLASQGADIDDSLYNQLFDEMFGLDYEDGNMNLDGADELPDEEEDNMVLELHDSEPDEEPATPKPAGKKRKASKSPPRKKQKVVRSQSGSTKSSSSSRNSSSSRSSSATRRSSRIKKNAASKASSTAGSSAGAKRKRSQ